MKRREFITFARRRGGSVAARGARAAAGDAGGRIPPLRIARRQCGSRACIPDGLKDAGFVEGENLAVEYRWADYQFNRLPALADDLVRRRVAVIVAPGGPNVAFAAKAAAKTIPIVFLVGEDPVRLGLVTSLARPDANLTGVNFFGAEVAPKRLELLRELVPGAVRIACASRSN